MAQCHADRVTGALSFVGNPGGLFHLCDGAVLAVDSSGAPGAEALLLRSGRINEGDWTAALRQGAETRSHEAALVARGTVGSAELHVLAMAATQDGAFATVAGDIEQYFVDDDKTIDALLRMPNGVAPDVLLPETARRLDALASLPFPVSPYRERVVPGHVAEPSVLPAERREIIAHATGRRTARDIAFAVGRGLYPVTVEISRMLSEGLLEIDPAITSISSSYWESGSLRPRVRTVDPNVSLLDSLPARRPRPTVPPDLPKPSGWRALSRLLGIFETERKHIGP